MSLRPVPLVLATLLLTLPGTSCITQPSVRVITPEETTWIQRGRTSREEVVARFGSPTLVSRASGGGDDGEFVEYAAPSAMEGPRGGALLEPRPRGAIPQVFQQPIETLRPSAGHGFGGKTFWIRYDEQGIVSDFGFKTPASE